MLPAPSVKLELEGLLSCLSVENTLSSLALLRSWPGESKDVPGRSLTLSIASGHIAVPTFHQ